jgi:hypothetical protein
VSLSSILNAQNPLGPADQLLIRDVNDATDILARVKPFERAFVLGASVIIGRKGSGKTSVICGYQAAAADRDSSRLFEEGQFGKNTFVEPVARWDQFHSMVTRVASIVCKRLPYPEAYDFLFPEEVSKVWHDVIWDHLFKRFYTFGLDQETFPTALTPIWEFFNLESINSADLSSVSKSAEQLTKNSRTAILRFLRDRNQTCYILFDNMDKYPIRNEVFGKVISGFLKCINKFNADYEEINIVFCMPEEVETFIKSDNLEKDYSKLHRLRWRPADLLQIVAHRYRLFIKTRQSDFYARIKGMDFRKREHLQDLFRIMFPNEVINRLGHSEHPIAYIVRHTQLLPRHLILMFNRILSLSQERSGNFTQIQPNYIRDAVEDIESTIAGHILAPYELIYPQLLAACRHVLPQLPPICTLTHLHRASSQFKQRIEEETRDDPWRVLVNMGVLGEVKEVVARDERDQPAGELGRRAGARQSQTRPSQPEGGSRQCQTQSRYVYGAFHYNSTAVVGFEARRRYCFHPLFSRAFGMQRAAGDQQRAVYPANIGLFDNNDVESWGDQLDD